MNRHHARGHQLLLQQRHAEAAVELRQARAECPWSSFVAHDLALALVNIDHGQEATAVAEKMVADDPEDSIAHATLGFVLLRRGLIREGEAALARALAIDPDDATTHALMARAHLERDNPTEALAATDHGLAIDPDNDLCLSFRARALLALDRTEEAKAISERLLQLDPEDGHNHGLRGEELLRSGDPRAALPHFQEALRINPGDEHARQHLILCLKARSPLFAWLLAGMIRLERVGLWTMVGIAIGVLFALRLVENALNADPVWMPVFATAKLLAIVLFFMALFSHQIYDVLLWLDKDGRHALSKNELRASRWFCVCFAAAGLCLWWGALAKNPRMAHQTAMGFLFLVRLVAATYAATPGYVRRRMAAVTIATAVFHLLSPILSIVLLVMAIRLSAPLLAVQVALMLGYVAVLIGSFSENILGWLEKRRPDAALD